MTNLSSQFQGLLDAISVGTPICDIMRGNERAAGFTVVRPGDTSWLSADDWDPTVVVSTNGKVVRLVAILAKVQCRGALTRTVREILKAGLVPQIVEPTAEMRATCKRWGWRSKRIGQGIEQQEIWYPRHTLGNLELAEKREKGK